MQTRKSTNTMKAWRFESASGRLGLEEVSVPALRPGAVLVRVQAAPVLSYMGDVLAGKLTTYRFPPRPFTPGTNGTGTVESIGGAVDVKPFPLDQLRAALTHAATMRGLEATILTM